MLLARPGPTPCLFLPAPSSAHLICNLYLSDAILPSLCFSRLSTPTLGLTFLASPSRHSLLLHPTYP